MLKSVRQNFRCRSRLTKWLISNEVFAKHFLRKDVDNSQWKGRTVVITGVTRGIGLLLLKKLLQLGMIVIIGCRNTLICREILLNIQEEDDINTSQATVFELDFMSLKSVRHFVNQIIESNTPIHLLINNARLFGGEYSETIDGFETHFQANCLSPFLLINLLLPILTQTALEFGSPIGRIVTVTSALMRFGEIDLNDLEHRNSYNPLQAYFNTQLIQILLLRQLFTSLRQAGNTRINICSVHPGIMACELPFRKVSRLLVQPFLTAKEDGANQVLYIALSSQMDSISGEFFIHPNCNSHPRNGIAAYMGNIQIQEKIWKLICNLVDYKHKMM